jgi:hypothetical protein
MNAIYKYNKLLISHRFTSSMIRGKKIIIAIRISKSGLIGMSKPCLACVTGMFQHKTKINLNYILYSSVQNNKSILIKKYINELINDTSLQISTGDSRRHICKKTKNI